MKTLEGIAGISKLLNVPKSWIYQRTRTNEIPHYKLGKYLKFDIDEVTAWLRGNRVC